MVVGILLATIAAILVWLFVFAADGFLVIFAGVLRAIFLTHVSSYLARHTSLNYPFAPAIVGAMLFLLMLGMLYFLGARIATRAETLILEVQ